MYNLIAVLSVLVIVIYGQNQEPMTRTDGYVYATKLQNANNIKNYDNQINEFKRRYNERIGTINMQLDMLVNAMEQNEARLYPLELLSDFSRECIRKHSSDLPTIATTKSNVEACKNTAINELNGLVSDLLNTRDTLQNYYTKIFEDSIANCESKYNILSLAHTLCITNLTASANNNSVSSQKAFAIQIDTAECSANSNIKKALDCTFGAFNRTITQITEANTFINTCLSSPSKNQSDSPNKTESECGPCDQMHTCSNIYYLNKGDLDSNASTMPNPLFGHESSPSCLLLKIYESNF